MADPVRVIKEIDATNPGLYVGRHSFWSPELGIKIPFQWGGEVTKYQHKEATYPVGDSLLNEMAILRALAERGMAPKIGRLVYVETLISNHPGAWHADPCGAWGYEIADARDLPPGRFSVDEMRKLPITGSPGAWNDISVPGRDNVVNGYLVDVRRSGWDALRWTGSPLGELPPRPRRSADEIRFSVRCRGQFPPGQRELAYQDFFLDGAWQRGERRVVERARALGFSPSQGETVVEIGCQTGGFLQLAALAGARAIGVEVNADYVECARELARANGFNIGVRLLDAVKERDRLIKWLRALFPGGIDHLLLLSMEKHLGDGPLFDLVDALKARRTYVETNAVAKDSGDGPEPSGSMKLWPEIQKRGGKHVGNSRDRNLRRLYRIG